MTKQRKPTPAQPAPIQPTEAPMPKTEMPKEIGGRTDGPEPTRYGDWEHNGKCVDF